MGRPPLPLGAYGKIRFYGSGRQWRARTLYRDYDGKTRDVERSGSSRAAAERALKAALRDRTRLESSGDITPETRVQVLIEAWWADFQTRGASPQTIRLYEGTIRRAIRPALGSLRVRELTVATIHRHLQAVAKTNGPATAKACRAILSGICAFATQRDALDRNPVRDAGPPRQTTPKRLPTSLTVAQAKQLMALLSYDNVAIAHDVPDLVGFMLATGARIGEACAMTWDAIDLEAGIVEIRGTKTTASVRTVRLPEWCIDLLRARCDNASERFSPDVAVVFPTSTGTLRDPSNVQKRLKEAFVRAGFEGITSHAMRKTAATLLDQAGLTAREIADQLGHARPSITTDVYMGRGIASERAGVALESLSF
jgi:integrase